MRYATAYPSAARVPRSRSIGRCARCHAAVLADEEHYGDGAALVHGACGTLDQSGEARAGTPAPASRPPAQSPRRMRRMPPATGVSAPLPPGSR